MATFPGLSPEIKQRLADRGIDIERSYDLFRLETVAFQPSDKLVQDLANAPIVPALSDPDLWDDRAKQNGFTRRELEVLYLASHGLSNAQIGQILHVGTETVKTHMRLCLLKLRAASRCGACCAALRIGLIE